jgi:hypothetical protein
MPPLTKACLDTHPCAADVERLCHDVPRGQIMRCLHGQRAALTPACAHSDDCFAGTTFSEDACGTNPVAPHGSSAAAHGAHGGNKRTRFHRGGLLSGLSLPWFGGGGGSGGDPQMLRHHAHPSHSLSEGPCACLDECGDHLHDAVCDPCDPAAIGHHDGTGADDGGWGWQAAAMHHGGTGAAHGASGHSQHPQHEQQQGHASSGHAAGGWHPNQHQQPHHHQPQHHQSQQQHGSGGVSSVHQHRVPILQRPARHYAAASHTHPSQHAQGSGEGQGAEGHGESVIPDGSARADDDDNPSGPEAAPGEPAPIPDDPSAASAEPPYAEAQGEAEAAAPVAEHEYPAEHPAEEAGVQPEEAGVQPPEGEGYASPVEHEVPAPPEHHLSGLGYVEGSPEEQAAQQQQHAEVLAQAAAAEAGVEEVPFEGGGAEGVAQPEAYQQAATPPESAASEASAADHAQAAADHAAAEQAAAEQEAMAAEQEQEEPAQEAEAYPEAAALLEVGSAAGNAGGHGAPRKPAFVAGQPHGMLGRGGHGQRQQQSLQHRQHQQPHGQHSAGGHSATAGGGHHTGSGSGGRHHGEHHGGHGGQQHKVCVRNPVCGLKRHWCRVSPECKAPFVTIADVRGCHGPYHGHRHRGCEGALMARLADPDNHPAPELPDHIHAALHERHAGVEELKRAAAAHIKAARHRCQLQEALSGAGEAHVCPRPTAAQWNAASSGPVEEGSLTHIRTCEAPPPFLSFVRHFLDNVASAFGGQHGQGQHAQAGHGGAHAGAGAAGRGFHVPTIAPSAHEAAGQGHPPHAAAHHAPPAHGIATSGAHSSGSGAHAGVSSIHHPHAAAQAQQQQQHPAPAPHVQMPFSMGRRDASASQHRMAASSGYSSGGGQGNDASAASPGWFGGAAVRALIGDASRELVWLYGVYVIAVLSAGAALLLCWCVVASRRRQIYGPGSHYAKGDASRIGIGAMCQALGRGCCCSRLCPSVFGTYQGSAGKLARLPALAAGSAPQHSISGEALVQR